MTTVKSNELTTYRLDWFVAQALKIPCTVREAQGTKMVHVGGFVYSPSTLWEQGGRIIDAHDIMFEQTDHIGVIRAYFGGLGTSGPSAIGRKHLTTAMRAIVVSYLGSEVTLPSELEYENG